MSKLNLYLKLPPQYDRAQLADIFREIENQVNKLSEGSLSASYTAKAAAPTTGTWTKGDFVKNNAPAEAGSAGGMYVVTGWICTASGTPGTWLESRVFTGN